MLLLFGESSYLSRNFWISLFRAFFPSVLSFNCTQPKVIYPRFLYWNVPFLPRQIVKNGKMFLDCIFNRKIWYSLSIWKLCKGLVRFFSALFSGYLQVALTQSIPNYFLLEFPVFDGALRWQTLLAMKINWIKFLEITLMFTVDIDIFNLFDTKEINESASNKNIRGNRLVRT